MSSPFGLTDQQKRFADGLLEGKTQRRAYIDAGYKATGAAADASAARLVRNAKVAAYLESRRQKLQRQVEVTQERVMQEYARLAFSDMRNYATWGAGGVTLRESDTLTPDSSAAVAEVSESDGSLKFKLHDKRGALDSVAKILGMMTERTVNIDIHDLTIEELERIANGEDPISVLADTRASRD